jgi:succinoglycan biosynthesis protein ExoM
MSDLQSTETPAVVSAGPFPQSNAGAGGGTLVVIPTLGRRPLQPLVDEVQRQMRQLLGRSELVVLSNGPLTPRLRDSAGPTQLEHLAAPGLATVRNRALDRAEGFDRLIFIDDDEIPGPEWLSGLLAAERRWEADVVVGPVRVRVPASAPGWLDNGELLRPHRVMPDGPLAGLAYSGNTLLGIRVLRDHRLRFDPAFDFSGGEDTDFFWRLQRLGLRTVMANEGVVEETPDADRLTLHGVLRRSFNSGSIHWRATRAERKRVFRLVRRTGRIVRGAALVVAGVFTLRASRCVAGLMDIALSVGTVSAVLGVKTTYYREKSR